jgi:outer membrane receptor for ferrienterochelin and colicin
MLKTSTNPTPHATIDRVPARCWCARWRRAARTAFFLIFAFSRFAPCALANDNSEPTGRLEGTVFVVDRGHQILTSGAKVQASGPVQIETETNADGKYVFVALPPGTYTVEVTSSGLEATEMIVVHADQVVTVPLQLKLARVDTSVTVTASDAKTPASIDVINEKTVRDAPNINERFDTLLPLVPGVVRGPDGHINLKGASSTQSGALVNSANVTDPATGSQAINLPIDVVSSVHVLSNPYDPQYGRFTGAVSSVETKTGNFEKSHLSIQNVLPRWRDRGGHIVGIGAATPRMTFTGPLVKDRIALTQSLEYRYVRTPVNSLPPMERDTTLQGYNSYTQSDLNLNSKQTATVSFALYPQKLQYMGLNTFTPQPATADFHQRGYQIYGQHRYVTGTESALVSQLSYKRYDADVTAQSNDQYQLLIDTTQGGFFNRQARQTDRTEWNESYDFSPRHFHGTHQMRAGSSYAYSSYDGREAFLPVDIICASGLPIERISFTDPTSFNINQNESSWFLSDHWALSQRLTLDTGMRFDSDTVTGSVHAAPRAGFLFALTNDGKTLLKGGAGMFYDRVPLMFPTFEELPDRTVTMLDPSGQTLSSTFYLNKITNELQNPRSTSWNIAVERQVLESLNVRVGYEQRNTSKVFVVSPISDGTSGVIALSNSGRDSYQEIQVAGRYKLPRITLNSSYVHSRAYGNLNDPSLFFGNYPQAVIQPDARARLPFDAPNRFLFWGDIAGPKKLMILPVYDVHTGFPYSVENEFREYVGPRDSRHYPRFSSFDLQVLRPISLHIRDRQLPLRAGFTVFNVFNHFNPRDVQNVQESSLFGDFFNNAWREYRGKLVFQF